MTTCGVPGSNWVQFNDLDADKPIMLNRFHISAIQGSPHGGTNILLNCGEIVPVKQPYITVRRVLLQMEGNVEPEAELQTP